jgi:hypothetical protein
MDGDKDAIIDSDEGGAAMVRDLRENLRAASAILKNTPDVPLPQAVIEPDADHRPYFLSRPAIEWLRKHLGSSGKLPPIPSKRLSFGEWVDSQGQRIEKLYNTEARERGLKIVDIGAVYLSPNALACFPERSNPTGEYTMAGWVKRVRAE